MQKDDQYEHHAPETAPTSSADLPPNNLESAAANSAPQTMAQHLFKYHDELKVIVGCPPVATQSPVSSAYRFAHPDLSDPNNSLPPIKIKPERFIVGRPQQCCTGFGLSMYTTLAALRARAEKGIRNSPNFLKKLGTHYARVTLTTSCGRQTPPDLNGHFDLYEYSTFNFSSSVVEHAQL